MTITPGLIIWLVAGIALGAVYMYALWRSVRGMQAANGWLALVGPMALRLGMAGLLLVFAARHGPLPVIAVLIGFLLTRTVVIRRMREGQ